MKRLLSMTLALILALTLAMPASAAGSYAMNRDSATIDVGSGIQLKVLQDGREVSGVTWASSDTSVASVDSTGYVQGKAAGSAVIIGTVNGTMVESIVSVIRKSQSATKRYNVLILDTSGSMKGTPLKREKTAAKRFCRTVLKSDGKNYVAVIALHKGSAKVVKGFTGDYKKLAGGINSLKANNKSNLNAAMKKAEKLLKKIKNGRNVMKNVVICSDGLPVPGDKLTKGRYKKKDSKSHYKYANAVYKTDVAMKKKKYFIYALGFFQNASGKSLAFGKRHMKDLASKDKYYEIKKSSDFDKAFEEIAQTIVSVTLNRYSLSLKEGDTYQLKAYKNGAGASAKWKSSNEAVATVNSKGKVTAKGERSCKITATVDGVSAVCTVTVKKKPAKDITDELKLYGDAIRLEDGSIRLTELKTWQSGSVWYAQPIGTKKGFTAYLDYWAGGGRDDSYGGADGIVLNIADKTGLGAEGADMGFVGGYGIELDSYPGNSRDPDGKHVAVIQRYVSNHLVSKADDRVDDSNWHQLKVVYSGTTLMVYLDSGLVLTQENVTLNEEIYLGVSAATGSGKNAHYIKNFIIS